MAIKKVAKEVANEVKAEAVKVSNEFDGEIDPLLNEWKESKVSGWLAVGGGVALLAIGFVLGNIF